MSEISTTEAGAIATGATARREFNFSAIIIGPPGCGKTTLAIAATRMHLEAGGVVLAHDPVQQFARAGCAVYADAAAWRAAAAAAAKAGKKLPRGASIGGSSSDVTRLALDIGVKCNSAALVRVPILVPYDEGSLLADSGSTWMGATDNEALAIRRHRGCGFIFNVQQPNQLMSRFYNFATDVCVFRSTGNRARMLDDLLLLEPGELERAGVSRLPRYHFIHVRPGEGIVREPLTVGGAAARPELATERKQLTDGGAP